MKTVSQIFAIVVTGTFFSLLAGVINSPVFAQSVTTGTHKYPIDLTTALRLAGIQNLRIAEAEAQARDASGELLSAYERLLPSLSAETYFTSHTGLTQATEGSFPDVTKQSARAGGHVYLSWKLSESLFEMLSARQRERATTSRTHWVSNVTLREVAFAYFDLVTANANARIAQRSVEISTDLVRQIENGIIVGTSYQADLFRARAQSAQDNLAAEQAETDRLAASGHLIRLLNFDKPVDLTPLDSAVTVLSIVDTSTSEERWRKTATTDHPVIRELDASLSAAGWNRRQALWGPLLPELRADAFLSGLGRTYSDLHDSRDYGISVRWTIGPGGLFDFGRIRSTSARYDLAKIRRDAATDSLAEEVTQAFGRIRIYNRMQAIARQGLEDARSSFALSSDRQSHGISFALEVIDAAEALQRAEFAHVKAITSYNKAQIDLLVAAGELSRMQGR